jgi:hypothetical protein
MSTHRKYIKGRIERGVEDLVADSIHSKLPDIFSDEFFDGYLDFGNINNIDRCRIRFALCWTSRWDFVAISRGEIIQYEY